MSVDKKEYWKNREKGLRGQGEKIAPVTVKKGIKIFYEDKDGKKKEFPNNIGKRVFKVGAFSKNVNRAEARKKVANRQGSAKNYEHQQGKWESPFSHAVNKHDYELPYPPHLSNNTRHRDRQAQRKIKFEEARRKAKDEQQQAATV